MEESKIEHAFSCHFISNRQTYFHQFEYQIYSITSSTDLCKSRDSSLNPYIPFQMNESIVLYILMINILTSIYNKLSIASNNGFTQNTSNFVSVWYIILRYTHFFSYQVLLHFMFGSGIRRFQITKASQQILSQNISKQLVTTFDYCFLLKFRYDYYVFEYNWNKQNKILMKFDISNCIFEPFKHNFYTDDPFAKLSIKIRISCG